MDYRVRGNDGSWANVNASGRVARNLFLTLLAVAAIVYSASAAQAATPSRLVAYVTGSPSFPAIPAERLTAINFAFAHMDAQGHAVLSAGSDAFIEKLCALKARNPKLQILISVGGWGADGFSDAAASPAARSAFADSVADLLARTQTDGIDLDWEYPGLPGPGIKHRPEDRENFTALLAALHKRLDALARERRRERDPYAITAALADGEFVAHIALGEIHRSLDWINLMTYDFHNSLTPQTGHHAALRVSASAGQNERSIEKAVAQFRAAGVPARKLVLGVPFYGRGFADVHDANRGLDQPYGRYAGDHSWPQLVADFIDKNGFVRYWDSVARVPYLWNADKREFISYDDPQSLALKAQYVKAHGLGGIMYWEQSQDPRGELSAVLERALH